MEWSFVTGVEPPRVRPTFSSTNGAGVRITRFSGELCLSGHAAVEPGMEFSFTPDAWTQIRVLAGSGEFIAPDGRVPLDETAAGSVPPGETYLFRAGDAGLQLIFLRQPAQVENHLEHSRIH